MNSLTYITSFILVSSIFTCIVFGHEAKDFDDSVLYRIKFEVPDFDEDPSLKNQIRTFHTHDHEKYDCVIPVLEVKPPESELMEPKLSPYFLLQPIFSAPTCSYRIEAYWSYEICHGHHVRQYHEERDGKNKKSQEYYLGKWSEDKIEGMVKQWEEDRKANVKYKTLKIDNTNYPYFEMEMNDGTMCEIIEAPRKTIVRYVCYLTGKNEIYSFKETSSCNYEAIILTSALCALIAFHPEQSKEVQIQCYNDPIKPNKPLSWLREELDQLSDTNHHAIRARILPDEATFNNKEINNLPELLGAQNLRSFLEMDEIGIKAVQVTKIKQPDISPIRDFISGNYCITGGTGWWKYEFCYGRHVRQFHKDKKSELEMFLGYFSESAHKQWLDKNPGKNAKRASGSLWHHYEKGTHCDRTGQPREVDVKLTCAPVTNSATTVSIYLLEPKTCQYILVIDSPIVCDLIQIADEYGLVQETDLQNYVEKLFPKEKSEVIEIDVSPIDSNVKENKKVDDSPDSENANTKSESNEKVIVV